MGPGAILEPAAVVFLLVTGCLVNRRIKKPSSVIFASPGWLNRSKEDEESWHDAVYHAVNTPLPPSPGRRENIKLCRTRTLNLWWFEATVTSPDTRLFKERWFSRVIEKFPFLVEVWYWALIYWVSVVAPSAW